MLNKAICMLIILISCFNRGICQTATQVRILIPKDLDKSKLRIFFDDGKERRIVSGENINENEIALSEKYYYSYGAVSLMYFSNESRGFGRTFFVYNTSATINIFKADSLSSPLDKYEVINAADFKKDVDDFENYAAPQSNALKLFLSSNVEKLNKRDTSTVRRFEENTRLLQRKQLEFIREHGNSYYCFWYFKRNLATSSLLDKNELLAFFNEVFPAYLRTSNEGTLVAQLLNGSIHTFKNDVAPDFVTKDIKGNAVSLKKYVNKRPLLLVFGASWCVPCMKEVPNLIEIKEQYRGRIDIVYVTLDKNESDFLKIIREKKFDWTNVFYDPVLVNAYGGENGIPQIYLINKSAKIIYNQQQENDVDLTVLKKVLKKLD